MDKILCLIIFDDNNKEVGLLPLFDHPHNDKENGQNETHYHSDLRYIDLNSFKMTDKFKRKDQMRIDLPLKSNEKLEYRELNKISDINYITPVEFIHKSKLKHKCIHKGKCPHRGYDLSNVESINGVIECPLHGLQFNSKTKKIIKNNERI